MPTADDLLLSTREEGLLRLTLNRPEKRNALNDTLMESLAQAFAAASDDPGIRAIVLTGAGDRAFCAGADLTPAADTFGFDYSEPRSAYAGMLRAARACTVPVIGRINGFCLAGGMGLLAICDMAVASADAQFGLPEVKVGLFPMQVAALLQRMLPPRVFAEMCYTGERLDAAEGLAHGLVNAVVPATELDAKVDEFARRVMANSPTAIRRGKYALAATEAMTVEQALAHMEAQAGLMALTEDAKEGMAAFAAKRAPRWTGR